MINDLKIPFWVIFPILLFSQTQLSQLYLVGDAGESSSEIVAVRDANGEFCSGIQVISEMEGLSYNSYNGVVRVDDEKGKDMVYVSSTERILEIYQTGYEPLKLVLSEIGILLKPRSVWTIRVAGELNLIINSYPDHAEIYMNNTYLGITPYQGKIRRGTFDIRLKKDLYHELNQTIQVVGDTVASYTFDMLPGFGSLLLTSEPSGAEVFLDGSLRGMTKMLLDTISSGNHLLTLRKKPLYHDIRKTITIKDGEIFRDNILLELNEQGLYEKNRVKWVRRRNWTAVGTGTFALAGLGCKLWADQKYNEYTKATSSERALELREQVENFDLFTIISFSASGAFAGWTVFNQIKIPRSNIQITMRPVLNGMTVSASF